MKTLKKFMEFTNLKGQIKGFVLLLMVTSFLYCSIYTILMKIIYGSGSTILYYMGLYLLIVGAAYVYMLVLFQFVNKKRENVRQVDRKACLAPLLMVQTVFYVLMVGGSLLSYTIATKETMTAMQYIVTPVLLLLLLLYVPWQIFCIFEIYDGKKNPFLILKDALVKMGRHYQSIFYSLLVIGAMVALFYSCMDALFQMSVSLVPYRAVVDIICRSNPFLLLFELMSSVFDNVNIALPAILSLVYGVIMCIALSFYYMVMICIYDEDIRV